MNASQDGAVRPRIVYSRHYNIGCFGLERLHPFDSRKYGRAYHALRHRFGRALSHRTISPERPIRREELLHLHTSEYLAKLKDPAYVARALEIPLLRHLPAWAIDRIVLRPMRWATAGTILAAREALTCGLAFNLSGGYHHAGPDRGEGFSIYNDIALAIGALRRDGALGEHGKVVYVDCDAHQGNGVCHAFEKDPRVFIYDLFNSAIYPASDAAAKRRIDCPVPVSPNRTSAEYLATLKSTLPGFLEGVAKSGPIAFAVYIAGTDIFRDDPLGGLAVSAHGVLSRDRFVLRELVDRKIPTVMLPSGGYTRQSYELIADSIADALETWPESL